MAKGNSGQTLEKLYIELGLDISQLQADILAADKTVTENLGRLNREKNTIKLRMEADIASLDRVKDATKILEIQERALSQQLTIQTDRMKILEAAYKQVASNANSTATAVQKAEQAFLREKIAVGQLQQQLKALASQKTPAAPTSSNKLLSGYQGLKSNAAEKINELTSAFNTFQGATSSADTALTAALGIIGGIPAPAAAATAALVGIPLVLKGIENSIINLAKGAAASGDAIYVMSRGFQMSVADTGKFSTTAKIAGVEVNDLATAVKNVQRQVARGGEDSRAAEWLKRYGESAYDANGNLKNLNEMTFSLSRALKRAQADGKGAEFVLNAFRNVSADAITAIEDWADVSEQASTIVKAGLVDPKYAHSVQWNINALNVQSAQLGTSFKNALLPVANEIIPRLTERLGRMTQIIKDNKDSIKALGEGLASIAEGIEATIEKGLQVANFMGDVWRKSHAVRETTSDAIVEKYKDDKSIQTAKDILEREMETGGYSDEDLTKIRTRNQVYHQELEKSQNDWKKLYEARREALAESNKNILVKFQNDDSIKSAADLLDKLTDAEKKAIEQTPSALGSLYERVAALNQVIQTMQDEYEQEKKLAAEQAKNLKTGGITAGIERHILGDNEELIEQLRRARKYQENADAILYKMNHTDYENKLYDEQRWLLEQLPRDAEKSMVEYEAIMQEHSARLAQIEKDRADEMAKVQEQIQEHYKNAADIQFEITHTAFEKELRDIEQWKDAQLEKVEAAEEVSAIVAEAAAKEARAFEREVDRIKGKTQTLYDKIFEIDHSQYENDLRKIQQEYLQTAQELQESGVLSYYKNDLDYLFERQQQELAKRAAKDKNYRKSPEGATERGGNGIMVISGDKITDDGLIQNRQKEIGLLADENQIRAQLLQKQRQELSGDVMVMLAQKLQSIQQPQITLPPQQQQSGIQIIEGDKVVSMPQMPTQPLQEFSYTLQQLNAQMRQIPATEMPAKQTTPIESFQTLKNSTEGLTTAQNILAEKFRSMQIANPTITQGVITPDMPLNNFDVPLSSILHELQMKQETTISTETIVMPLNNIASIAQNILSAMGNANQPDITVSPNIRIDLGGAYVFDNGMKKTLTDDITKEVVGAITTAVNQATRQSSYSYGA